MVHCDHRATELAATAEDVALEMELRREFFLTRLDGLVDEHDLRDLVEMTTDDSATIHRCIDCGTLVRSDPIRTASPIVQQLAYNNVLGFPHRFGYSEATLAHLATQCGFKLRSKTNVQAIRPLRERLTTSAREEESRVAPAWIEAMFTRL